MDLNEYKRLTGTRSRSAVAVAFTSRASLWLGVDHLLLVDSSGYVENYKRFYFGDIQSLTMQKTLNWQTWNFIWSTASFIALALAAATKPAGWPSNWDSNESAGAIFFTGFTALFVLFLLINFWGGATCKCHLRTAVQIEELPSLRRIRQSQKIMAKIRPLIATAQGGELSPAAIAELARQPEAQRVSNPATPAADEPAIPPKLD